ncbi:MAG: SWIM zinc finger domain-containing protein [Methanosarcina sp.]|uniref:SWIM zinc finger domain-containing protein n=1 Tax=Methanosarcina sp. TaxID=2213 RepID=UPI00261B3846|nr:SWIM zinc finger domain-containing protein [Methanosarcina sp.]MDD3248529.1 SWIM zinc finger domain-containing protein [Methanosarcina sp.]MDD4248267.1 SWIM zinc finger domain-containing protein [Methanosarcina sp.]
MPSESENSDPFQALKWSDLQAWAGEKATAKGMKYQDEERVKEIKQTPEGSLIARVQGTKIYFTEVSLENGELSSTCTCPVEHDCKHGVAAVLEYLELAEQGEEVPIASEGDPLIIMARQGSALKVEEARDSYQVFRTELREYLEQMEKEELIDLLMNLSDRDSLLTRHLQDMLNLASGDTEETVGNIYSELEELWEEARSYDYRDYDSPVPDFSDLRNRLESLLETGYADEVADLGMRILEGYEEIAPYDEEKNIGMEIGECMGVVIKALLQSGSPAHESMLKVLDLELKDECGIFDEEAFWNSDFPVEEWYRFSEVLKDRLEASDSGKTPSDFDWDRGQLVKQLVLALEKAGNYEEAISLCEEEVEAGEDWSYVRLIKVLLSAGQKEKAEEWIYREIKETRKSSPETAYELFRTLLEIKEKEENWLFVAALHAEEFFRYPSLQFYTGLRESAKKAGVWEEIRKAVHEYLESGSLPADSARPGEEISSLPGILPKTGLTDRDSFKKIDALDFELLIDIAIEEKNPDEVARWYNKLKIRRKKGEDRYFTRRDKIARTVQEKYPEIAIDIWKTVAEELISRTKVEAYESASIYLRMVRNAMEAGGQKAEWESYLSEIREKNRLKRKLLEILDILGKDRIIEE